MKIMNVLRIFLVSVALIGVQANVLAVNDVIDVVRQDLEKATNEVAKKITEATIAKNHIRLALINKEITAEQAAAKINEQDAIVAGLKEGLKELAEEAVMVADEVEKQASYASQFMSGAQSLGVQGLAKVKSMFGYSDQEVALAKAVIAELG